MSPLLHTVGHGNRSVEEFVALLTEAGIGVLVAHGAAVMHLIGPGQVQPHRLNPSARIVDGRLIYDRLAQRALF